jgi:hypothetical protein
MNAEIVDINFDRFNVTECTITHGWVHYKLNGKRHSAPAGKVAVIIWRD